MSFSDLVDNDASDSELRRYLAKGEMVAITFRIPKNLKDSAVEISKNQGISFSAFVRMCMITEMVKRG